MHQATFTSLETFTKTQVQSSAGKDILEIYLVGNVKAIPRVTGRCFSPSIIHSHTTTRCKTSV